MSGRRLLHPLDRYVFNEFLKIMVATALGFPILVIVIDVTESLGKYLAANLAPSAIAKAYLFGVPSTMLLVLPASVLFATVFSIGGFTRHSEITAAKASGISFHRFIAPIAIGATLATALALVLSSIAPRANARRDELLQDNHTHDVLNRYNFTFATAEGGRVYQITSANVPLKLLEGLQIDRKGNGPDYPTQYITARRADYSPTRGGWQLGDGAMHVLLDDSTNLTIKFDSLRDRHFSEKPENLMVNPKAPEEMGYYDLGLFIQAMQRSGSDVNKLRTERMLKIAIPATCLIIMLFGAPLATSNQRGGAAIGVGISLGTTVIFLMLVQLTQAIGAKGIVNPDLAAWLPGILFSVVGIWLLAKVRT